ncbi:MAG: RNA polymerase sigma factor [Phycisphaerales bacterium]
MPDTTGNAESAPTGAETPNADPAVLLLCRGVRSGDRGAFTALYHGWYGRWVRDAQTMLGRSDPLAHDIVQDAFVRVIRSLPELRSEAALASWMSRTLRSAAVDVLRKESRRRARERARPPGEHAPGGTPDDSSWLTGALAGIEASDALLLRARVVEDLTLEEAGRASGLTSDAAHGRIRRALAALRAAWRRSHD